ncbi:hypothetical protein SEVIR_2G371975v4 [Setaria viridis]
MYKSLHEHATQLTETTENKRSVRTRTVNRTSEASLHDFCYTKGNPYADIVYRSRDRNARRPLR